MSDSKLVRGFQARLLELPEGLLVAALYAAACWASRQVSVDQFFLPGAVRIAALLVFRPSMWPYLLLGDYAYFGCIRAPMVERYGLTWALIASCYPFPLVASLVYVDRRDFYRGDYANFFPMSLICAVAVGVLNAAAAFLLWPEPPQEDYGVLGVRQSIGGVLAIVTVAPLAMLWMRPAPISELRSWLGTPSIIMLIALVSMTGFALFGPIRQVGGVPVQLLMALPAMLRSTARWREFRKALAGGNRGSPGVQILPARVGDDAQKARSRHQKDL